MTTSPPTPHTVERGRGSSPLTRRSLLGLAGAATVVPLTGASSSARGPGHGHGHHHGHHHGHGRGPRTVALPDGIQPEGITSGPGTTYYVGSLNDGRIVTGDLRRGGSRTLLAGSPGRQLRGLQRDRRSDLVWAAGNVGAEGHVYAVDDRSGEVVADVVVPGALFLNDLVVTTHAVWVTDSQVDRLTGIGISRGGRPTGAPPVQLPLSGAWPAGDGVAFNANGIRELEDRSLILNNSRVGGLWNVDPATGDTVEIPVRGGPGLIGGDGLELEGDTLYDVRGSGDAEVSVLRLRTRHHGRWSAEWRGARRDRTLDVPSTATVAGGSLWAVNARFGVESPETASYWITRLPR